jgi:hypothetical protein
MCDRLKMHGVNSIKILRMYILWILKFFFFLAFMKVVLMEEEKAIKLFFFLNVICPGIF